MFPKPNHKRRIPFRRNRSKFSKTVREQVYERDNGICQQCGGKGTQIHHIKYRSQGGRGVLTNALTVCQPCHTLIHNDINLSNEWVKHYESMYGKYFYHDEWD